MDGGERKWFSFLHALTLVMSGPKAQRWKTLHHFYWLLCLPCKLTQKTSSFMHYYYSKLFDGMLMTTESPSQPRPHDASISDATHACMDISVEVQTQRFAIAPTPRRAIFSRYPRMPGLVFMWWVWLTPTKALPMANFAQRPFVNKRPILPGTHCIPLVMSTRYQAVHASDMSMRTAIFIIFWGREKVGSCSK